MKDKERYRSEMVVYRERLQAGQVISNAIPIQQRPAEPVGAITDMGLKLEMDDSELPEGDENGSSSDDSSNTEGKKSDEESEPDTSPDVERLPTESTNLAPDPSTEDMFELRRRDQVPAEEYLPSSSCDAEPKKISETSIDQH